MLEIRDLRATAGDKEILKGITLSVNAGEVHAIMGPNGSGKSTLAQVLAGHPAYAVTGGTVTFDGEDLLGLEAEKRAQAGVFLAFQYPVEIPGVTNAYFLRAAYNEIRKARGQDEVDPMDFLDVLEEKLKVVEWEPEIMSRAVNSGFSGGEKKRNEILQMAMLEPRLAILDETDSGLDIDALRIVAGGVNTLRRPDNATIVVTHYQRLLNYIVPDFVHVLSAGRIVKSGGKELALELEARGYEWVENEVGVAGPRHTYASLSLLPGPMKPPGGGGSRRSAVRPWGASPRRASRPPAMRTGASPPSSRLHRAPLRRRRSRRWR